MTTFNSDEAIRHAATVFVKLNKNVFSTAPITIESKTAITVSFTISEALLNFPGLTMTTSTSPAYRNSEVLSATIQSSTNNPSAYPYYASPLQEFMDEAIASNPTLPTVTAPLALSTYDSISGFYGVVKTLTATISFTKHRDTEF
jgi:hypothetical protein